MILLHQKYRALNILRRCTPSLRFVHSHPPTVLQIIRANIFRLGDADPSRALLHNVNWRVEEEESWAVIGHEKGHLLETLLGHHRVTPPPPGGIFPFLLSLDPPRDAHDAVSTVSFATRRRATGGGFYDFTARYGALRDEERITLRESLLAGHTKDGSPVTNSSIEEMSAKLQLEKLLDLPLIALSNGQTRRASILRELLERPEVLVLDEPLTGLDVQQRPILTGLLRELHTKRQPRIIMGLRPQDPLPEWITHLAVVQGKKVNVGLKDEILKRFPSSKVGAESPERMEDIASLKIAEGRELVSMRNVNVGYHDREVLVDINWTIREGDRWHLQGPNGSGKTTLLSVLTGDHPQSYTQSDFHLFGKPRKSTSTIAIQRQIGFVSPELFNAFPRRSGSQGLSVRDAIATGFESTFSYRSRSAQQDLQIDEILEYFAEEGVPLRQQENSPFASLSSGEQALVLLLRALISRPPLLILDEVFAGMDEVMLKAAKGYLKHELQPNQAVVFVSHWKEELPWGEKDVKRMTLSSK